VYGLLLIVGGVMGKVKSGSTVSMVAGCLSGAAALAGYVVSFNNPDLGILIGGMLGLLLSGVFLSRFFRTRKMMPAGVVLMLSICVGASLMYIRSELASEVTIPLP
jgi:uncharacterized membrane protein (UPF0136 family)